eukprot:jgi/Tetstr1/456433/TSEL_043164.t2
MDYLRYVGGGGAKPSGVTMGCKYRQRTGACCCDNPPIGCLEPEERRARAATKSPNGAAPPRPPAAAAPPLPLPAAFALHRREVPALGWRCSAADAAAVVSAGVKLLDASGDASVEEALRAAAPAPGVLIATALPAPCDLEAVGALGAAQERAARLGRPCAELLMYSSLPDDANEEGVAAAATAWPAIYEALRGVVGITGVACTSSRAGAAFLRAVQAQHGASCMPDVLLVPTSPNQPERALLGLCRRLSVLPLALAPLAPGSQLPPDRALAWSCARGVPAVACAADAAASGVDLAALMAAAGDGGLAPLSAEDTAQLNSIG